MNQVKQGLQQYLDREVLPHLTTAKQFGLGLYMQLLLNQAESKFAEYANLPVVKALALVDANGNVDLDRLHDAAVKRFDTLDRVSIDIPVIGCFTFCRSDVETLCDLIRRA